MDRYENDDAEFDKFFRVPKVVAVTIVAAIVVAALIGAYSARTQPKPIITRAIAAMPGSVAS